MGERVPAGWLERPLHPALLTGYFLLFLAAANPGAVPAAVLLAVLGTGLPLAAGVSWLLGRAVGDRRRGALLASLLLVLFFTYGRVYGGAVTHLVRAVPGLNPESVDSLDLHEAVSALYLTAFAAALLLRPGERRLERVQRWANVTALLLLALVVPALLGARTGRRSPPLAGPLADAAATVDPATPRPDIYLIVLDGYGRADVLRRLDGFDDGPFLDRLRSLGFQVAPRSTANYAWTFLSLPSLLNLRYLPELRDDPGPGSGDLSRPYALLHHAELYRFLHALGYDYVHLASTYGPTRTAPEADEVLHCRGGVFGIDYMRSLVETTWLRVAEPLEVGDLARCHLRNLDALASMGSRPGPKFVFDHFLPPHHPYLFDRDGTILRHATVADEMDEQNGLWSEHEAYVEQVRFVNRRIGDALERILAESRDPPVILVVSDHGPLAPGEEPATMAWARMANLVAVHLPGGGTSIPDDVGLVDLFRIVLDETFGTRLGRLPEHRYYSPFGRPFDFVEVPRPARTPPPEGGEASSSRP
ncbi:MAG: hypothetical protein Q8W51_03545 [Candidatus Palauibacterales bacterium]|nr:hypothetical protein [Candidatus Palauibacterales bacterium]MDP2528785.1 hypothetical protein [Candidatus Palauibacterales bacterium]MDP2583629.1 hypothetical protein [Candidatus Palauibacterales bacterium]